MSRGATDGDRDGTEAEALDREENASRSHLLSKGGGPGRFQIALRLLAPAAAALALVSVITDDTRLDDDLVLIAPERASAGETIALRAIVYAGLNKPEGPSLIHARTRVVLKGRDGAVLASTELRPGHGPSHEGVLHVPKGAHPSLALVADAWSGDDPVTVERALSLVREAEPAPLVPRALGPLQQLALGPAREQPGAPAPSSLTVRVAGGVCVPEERCELLIYADPPSAIAAVGTPSATVEQASGRESSASVVAVRVRVHGPEADLALRVQGVVGAEAVAVQPIAQARALRLPVAMGADAMQLERAVLSEGERPKVALIGRDTRGIADVFGDAGWLHSTTVRSATPVALDVPALAPGLYRVQLRRDPFDSASAAARTIYVRGKAESDGDVLIALAKRVAERQREHSSDPDPLASRLALDPSAAHALELEPASRYLLAALDDGTYRLPAPISGYPLARQRALEHREDVRTLALIVLALAALSLVLLVVQRGLLASDQAASLLRASGTEHAGVRRAQLRMTLRVAGAALSVLLVFCAIALYLIIRGRAP